MAKLLRDEKSFLQCRNYLERSARWIQETLGFCKILVKLLKKTAYAVYKLSNNWNNLIKVIVTLEPINEFNFPRFHCPMFWYRVPISQYFGQNSKQ
jgi:hypothetical protein